MTKECAFDNSSNSNDSNDNASLNVKRKFVITMKPDGRVIVDWWCPEVEPLLDRLGVPDKDHNRTPWCG